MLSVEILFAVQERFGLRPSQLLCQRLEAQNQ